MVQVYKGKPEIILKSPSQIKKHWRIKKGRGVLRVITPRNKVKTYSYSWLFPPLRLKKIKIIKIQKLIIIAQKMGVTEEGTSMVDENKTRSDCQIKKIKGLFCFGAQPNCLNLRFWYWCYTDDKGVNMSFTLDDFDNHLMNGLDFCKKAYGLFEEIRRSLNGVERLRLRKGKLRRSLSKSSFNRSRRSSVI